VIEIIANTERSFIRIAARTRVDFTA